VGEDNPINFDEFVKSRKSRVLSCWPFDRLRVTSPTFYESINFGIFLKDDIRKLVGMQRSKKNLYK